MPHYHYTLIACATGWGPHFGGINSFNYDLLRALKASFSLDVMVVCVVPHEDEDTIAKVRKHDGVRLVSLGHAGTKLGPELAGEAWTALQIHVPEMGEDRVWLGHDAITGEIAKTMCERHGGRLALLHHMSYEHYENYAASSGTAAAKVAKQKNLFAAAEICLAVGPLLRDALAEWCGDKVKMLIPGLADEFLDPTLRRAAGKSFRCFVSGRLSPDNAKVKQAHLAVAAFATAVAKADADSCVVECLRGKSSPKLILRGVDFGPEPDGSAGDDEIELQKFAFERAGRVLIIPALPYTTDRATLFADLAGATVAMMPSWHEGFGLVGWEAIAAGVPLIVGEGSGLYRWLTEWRNGLYAPMVQAVDVKGHYAAPFFQEDDLEAVRKAMIEVATRRSDWQQKAWELRDALRAEFTWQACAQSMAQAFGWQLAARDARPPLPLSSATPSAAAPVIPTAAPPVPPAPTAAAGMESDLPRWLHLPLPQKTQDTHNGPESWLLRAEQQVIPFAELRLPFLQEQVDWAEAADLSGRVRLITGQGGVGKTRLALELCLRLRKSGRLCGFLNSDVAVSSVEAIAKELAKQSMPVLLVLDYAETRQEIVVALLKALIKTRLLAPVRLLLLARDGGDWWEMLGSKHTDCAADLAARPIPLPALYATEEQRALGLESALQTFAMHLGRSLPEQRPDVKGEEFAHPLYLHMAALAALFGAGNHQANALPMVVLAHEIGYWEQGLAQRADYDETARKQLYWFMALVTLLDGAQTARELAPLWKGIDGESKWLPVFFDFFLQFYREKHTLAPLRPDLLGETLVAKVLGMHIGPRLLEVVLDARETGKRIHALVVLARMLRRNDQHLPRVVEAVEPHFAKNAPEIVLACMAANPTPLTQELDGMLTRAPQNEKVRIATLLKGVLDGKAEAMEALFLEVMEIQLKQIDKVVKKSKPQEILAHIKGGIAFIQILRSKNMPEKADEYIDMLLPIARAHAKNDEGLSCVGMLLGLKAAACIELEQQAAGLAFANEAVEIFQGLSKKNPKKTDFAQMFATSLNAQAGTLAKLGRNDEALAASTRGLELSTELAQNDRARYAKDWADAWRNQAILLSECGRYEEALAASTRELELYTELAQNDRARYAKDWADAWRIHAILLSACGRYEEALVASTRELELYTELAQNDSARYATGLADVFHNLASRHGELGDLANAVNAAAQAVEHEFAVCTNRPHLKEDLCNTYFDYRLFQWLATENSPPPPIDPRIAAIDGLDDIYAKRVSEALITPNSASLQAAVQQNNTITPSLRSIFTNENHLLFALAEQHQLAGMPVDWREKWQRDLRARQGRIPVWMQAVASRAGITLPGLPETGG